MVQRLYLFLLNHGMIIMGAGFIMAIISLFVYMQTRFYGTPTPKIAFGCTIAGFGIYVLGRIFVEIARRSNYKKEKRQDGFEEEEE